MGQEFSQLMTDAHLSRLASTSSAPADISQASPIEDQEEACNPGLNLYGLIKPPFRASSPHPHSGDHDSLDPLLSGHSSTKAGLQYTLCVQLLSRAKLGVGSCLRVLVHAKSLQLCLTLCDPMDCSPPSSSVLGMSQVRVLEWVAIPSPGDLPKPGIQLASLSFLELQVDS